jgi:hypothetical protein
MEVVVMVVVVKMVVLAALVAIDCRPRLLVSLLARGRAAGDRQPGVSVRGSFFFAASFRVNGRRRRHSPFACQLQNSR